MEALLNVRCELQYSITLWINDRQKPVTSGKRDVIGRV
jgi:hypothetical protein